MHPAVGETVRGMFAKGRPSCLARCRRIQSADKRPDQRLGILYLAHLSTPQNALSFRKAWFAASRVPGIVAVSFFRNVSRRYP